MNFKQKIDLIETRGDFVSFVRDLGHDFQTNPDSWENRDIPTFLEALAAWVEDMDGYYRNHGLPVPDKPNWKNVADMLMGGKIYE